MDLTFLDRGSRMTPLLVRLYDNHKLYELAQDNKPAARAELSRAICALLETDVSVSENELVADVLIALLRQTEMDLRAALSERLSVVEGTPLRLALYLANEEIQVAEPVLKNCNILGDMDLIYIVKSKTPEYWQAIAKRKTMSDALVNALADTRDNPTVQALLENQDIILPPHALGVAADMAEDQDEIAIPLLQRSEVTMELAAKLYRAVGENMKKVISASFDLKDSKAMDALEDVLVEFETQATEFSPTGTMVKTAERYKEKGLLSIGLMMNTLKRGQFQSFIAQFSVYSDLSVKTVEDLFSQKDGKGLAIACKAFDIMKSDYMTLFLLTSRMRNGGRMVDVNDMSKAVAYYNKADKRKSRDFLYSNAEFL